MIRIAVLAAALFASAPAAAQNVTVIGPITVGDCAAFNSTTVIKDAGIACAGGALFANPTGSVGLTAVNGSALTAMRSDAAPPLAASVQSALTGTSNGVLYGTGTFGFSALTPVANSLLTYNNAAAPTLANIITGQNYLAAGTNTGEAYGYSFRNSTVTGTSVYTAINVSVPNVQDGIQSVLNIPSTATIGQATGFASYFTNNATATVNAVGLFTAGQCVTTGSACWGINTLLTDAAARTAGVGTGRTLLNELDFNVMNTGTSIDAMSIGGSSLSQPTSALGFICNSLNGSAIPITIKWSSCFITQDGVGTNAYVSGVAKNDSTPNTPSQASWFLYYDSTGTRKIASTFVDETGFAFLNSNSGVLTTLVVGQSAANKGQVKLFGNTSGSVILAPQAAAGTPTLTFGTSSGTPAVTASSPLAIVTATGNITCATCATTTNGGALSATAPITISAAGVIAINAPYGSLTANNGGIVYSGAANLAILAGTATASLPLLSGSTAAPTWATISYPTSATSGGVPYFSSATVMASSAAGTATQVMLWGGAGNAPTASGCTISASNSMVCSSATSFAPSWSITNTTADAGYPGLVFQHSRGGGNSNDGDGLGAMTFEPFANGGFQVSAQIKSIISGTASGSNVPVAITFFTSSASSSLFEACRITPLGGWSCGTTTDLGLGTVLANGTIKTLSTTVASSKTTGSGIFGGGIGVAGATYTDTLNVITMPQSAAAQSGTVCYASGTGQVNYDATLGCLASTLDVKDGWEDIPPAVALAEVAQLRAGTFTYKPGLGLPAGQHVGFAAEQVATIDDRLVGYRPDGKLGGVRYQQGSAMYAPAIRALLDRLEILERRIAR